MTRRGVAGVLLGLYLVALGAIAAWPTPVDRPVDGLLSRIIDRLHAAGFSWIDYRLIEAGANVALFVPFGILLAVVLGRGWAWLAFAGTIAATLTIEFGQLEFLAERHGSVGDLATNGLGGAIGVAIVVLTRAAARPRRRPTRSLSA